MAISARSRRRYKDWGWAAVFIAPTVVGLYLFFIFPMLSSVYISLTKWNSLTEPEFIGLANYVRLFRDPTVYTELLNTIIFTVAVVPLTIASALLLANSFNRSMFGTGYFRTVFFLPYIVLPVVTAQIGMTMFNSRFGLVNHILALVGAPPVQWLTDPWLVRGVIVSICLWASVGYYAIILLAGLQNIPRNYYEACELDGGGSWHKLTRITIPLLTPQLFFAFVMATISVLKMFDYVFVFGKSNLYARESLRTMAYGIYELGFTAMEMGYASAEAILLCVFTMGITIFQNVAQKRWVHYS
jgi:multiple sugar transport system permease protein